MKSIIYLYKTHKKHIPGLCLLIFFSLLSGVIKGYASLQWGRIVDCGIAADYSGLLANLVSMVFLILLDCIRMAIHYHIIGLVTESMFYDIRLEYYQKILEAEICDIEKKIRTGDIATRIGSDIHIVSDFIAGGVSSFSRIIFLALFGLIGCLLINVNLNFL